VREGPILIDRAAELRQLRDSLDHFRLVAVVGPGGIGKTTLAMHIAKSYDGDFPGGIHFIEGYAIGRGAEESATPLLGEIARQDRGGRSLLVIDGIDEISPRTNRVIVLLTPVRI
jgi:Holliday junction resolvasome RuvABC ATP-dependent DNA helicase subunit